MIPFVAFVALIGAADVPPHLADAPALVKALALADTEYTHGHGEVTWTGAVAAKCDCSGLVNHLLMHSTGTPTTT